MGFGFIHKGSSWLALGNRRAGDRKCTLLPGTSRCPRHPVPPYLSRGSHYWIAAASFPGGQRSRIPFAALPAAQAFSLADPVAAAAATAIFTSTVSHSGGCFSTNFAFAHPTTAIADPRRAGSSGRRAAPAGPAPGICLWWGSNIAAPGFTVSACSAPFAPAAAESAFTG